LGDWEQGKKEMLSVTAAGQAHPETLAVGLQFMVACGQLQLVEKISRLLCVACPDNPHGWFFLAGALNGTNRCAEAKELLLKAIERFPEGVQFYFLLASCCCRLGQFKQARQWWKKACGCYSRKALEAIALDDPGLCKLLKLTKKA
jgi:hypothetical protein